MIALVTPGRIPIIAMPPALDGSSGALRCVHAGFRDAGPGPFLTILKACGPTRGSVSLLSPPDRLFPQVSTSVRFRA